MIKLIFAIYIIQLLIVGGFLGLDYFENDEKIFKQKEDLFAALHPKVAYVFFYKNVIVPFLDYLKTL